MNPLILVIVGVGSLLLGSLLGYLTRQSIARKNYQTIEAKIEKRIEKVKQDTENLVSQAREKANQIIEKAKNDNNARNHEILKREQILLKRENTLDQKVASQEVREEDFRQKVDRLREIKENINKLHEENQKRLEEISGYTPEKAKEEIFIRLEKERSDEIMDRIRKLDNEGEDRFETRAKEILATTIQRYAASQVQDITTTSVALPSDEIKGRIIGKEGRNIKTLEKLTGVEIIVDDTPETVIISGFDPIRRQIAKTAIEKLTKDGRIQPARIEDMVARAETEIVNQVKKAGEQAVYETRVVGLDPKLVQILGRLKFRSSYGQNVLQHSIEVSYLAAALASEIGAKVPVARKAGLLHDIGKALDHQVEGSHVDIGMKVLEKFQIEPEVISAMKSHHEDYPYESIEAVLIQTADAISAGRPGARKDTLENYLRRLEELEAVANSFPGIERTYAIQAGREIRVFVRPGEVNDLEARKLARDIARRIEEELRYPGEIKVNVIRESRVIEYAK